jgi:hypothetical protein
MRKAYFISLILFTFASAYAYAAPPDTSNESFIAGALMAIGAQLLLVLVLAARFQKYVDGRVDARMKDDDSVFGHHRADDFAHEKMRRRMSTEFSEDLKAIRQEISSTAQASDFRHASEMKNLTDLVRPIVEQNTFAMKVMASQMRRGPGSGPEEEL